MWRHLVKRPIRLAYYSSRSQSFRKWSDLSHDDRVTFITKYVDLYKEKHPCSKSNVMYRTLASDMEEHDDTPYVFGILYNEIRAVQLGESKDNVKGSGTMGDPDFAKLLYK
ncbi:HFL154Wp [Eremothecium sinecaudum]|uniref:HFL154Wp n=1 Tax=Eremothecium sinecaudum TaxID=45286 RepID=A0A0X8HUG7_9SACH|nr:HFL154Wp [Eremothecium sinecaudum]AMD21702.1 HFL154Wp [Eremothecium sinecaudum]